jgi:hypothetical protein
MYQKVTWKSLISKGGLHYNWHLHIAVLNVLQSIDVGIAVLIITPASVNMINAQRPHISYSTSCPTYPIPALLPTSPTLSIISLLRRGFNELYMALTVSNRCVEDAQAETGKAGSETSARSRSKKC